MKAIIKIPNQQSRKQTIEKLTKPKAVSLESSIKQANIQRETDRETTNNRNKRGAIITDPTHYKYNKKQCE